MTHPDQNAPRLTLVLGDQLSPTVSSLVDAVPGRDTIVMAEVAAEAAYVKHHVKKIALVFAAMRHFAHELQAAGHRVRYVRLDDPLNSGTLAGEVARALPGHARVVVTEPGEARLSREMSGWEADLGVPVEIRADSRFLCSIADFRRWADGRRELRLEWFYRDMRRKTGLLMDGDAPEGGQWNYDHDNRKPPKAGTRVPRPPVFAPNPATREVLDLVARRFAGHFGRLEPFGFAVTRADAERARDWFLAHALPRFGDWQDAMVQGEPFLWHSLLSPYLNLGLLDPLDLCRRVEAEYRAGRAPLNAAEGFIRQVIGWREYVRGVYWLMTEKGDYTRLNALDARQPLPAFYWTGDTTMACLSEVVGQTRDHAYAHHIQRLMITGNFALIAGVDPHAVHEWYLSVYADAYEWVEAPNTIGMSLFADGGVLASKPYAASANYIRKMSNYCDGCRYDPGERTGARACPFNFLYWDFIARHESRFAANPRMAFPVKAWRRFSAGEQAAIRAEAKAFLDTLAPADASWTISSPPPGARLRTSRAPPEAG